MARLITFPDLLKLLAWWVGAVAALAAGPFVALWLLSGPAPALWLRWLAVAVSLLSFIPWVTLLLWGVRRADEYQRQIFLVGTAFAFLGDVLLSTAIEFMKKGQLIGPSIDIPQWPIAIVLWLLGVWIASAYYRLR